MCQQIKNQNNQFNINQVKYHNKQQQKQNIKSIKSLRNMNNYQKQINDQDSIIIELNYAVEKLKNQQLEVKGQLNQMDQGIGDLQEGIDKNSIKSKALQQKLSNLQTTNGIIQFQNFLFYNLIINQTGISQIQTILVLFGILCFLIFIFIYI
ncbi:transmembrane protein, putative (macronuclear) [Tetrahymena thermophila SB210]|uniref:Transmembrane protein, putative n=1 Tax=Tetrahymena thermophila (strain SB210) TaxID=312017 RepID=I7M170_TETTS|nr:transmembrane protein, putative [Tetrahymena thermophila SB210]EAR95614.2 transmembrane protein, putative [Tetrahymena thermophila SB210]|eukprot:XP_001015859.2 transmembrane protein, putative [Tetrahymena thermophila SB210]